VYTSVVLTLMAVHVFGPAAVYSFPVDNIVVDRYTVVAYNGSVTPVKSTANK